MIFFSDYRWLVLISLMVITVTCCGRMKSKNVSVTDPVLPLPEDFDTLLNGKKVALYILKNRKGMDVRITNYGARVVSLVTPDREGRKKDIVLGFSTLAGYLKAHEVYFGATIGRYANRIANASFSLDDTTYRLTTNDGPNTLHGGPGGFHHVVWDVTGYTPQQIVLTYHSPAGEEGFPGNLDVRVQYTLTDDNELIIEYGAGTDRPTVVNLTHHSFFNLKGEGEGEGTIRRHRLMIHANQYTPVDEDLIPVGIDPVHGTPFDFRIGKEIGRDIDGDHVQLVNGRGYDHNFVLAPPEEGQFLRLAAEIFEPLTRRTLIVRTNELGLQFYSGNFLNGSDTGKSGRPYEYRGAFCLETQHFPDSPNQKDFPSTILRPEKSYHSICIYTFGVQ